MKLHATIPHSLGVHPAPAAGDVDVNAAARLFGSQHG
jgi:hypothetical protein